MSKIKRLIASYNKYIAIPWRSDAAAAQRVIFCVYNESDELRLRSKIDEFEIATRDKGHDWALFDLTDTFAERLSQSYTVLHGRALQRDERADIGGTHACVLPLLLTHVDTFRCDATQRVGGGGRARSTFRVVPELDQDPSEDGRDVCDYRS